MKVEHSTPPRQQKRSPDPPPQFDSSDLGSPKKVWSLLCEKDEKLQRDPKIFARQTKLNAKMRSMLLDWLMDVCTDKHLHRETFHLCIDYVDRYIALSEQQVQPQRLQLIGSTALVIATKIEEIYPPKISEIADYSDGCCDEADIRCMEELMLEKLDWSCYPVTAVHWLALYMQLMNTNDVVPARQVIVTAAKHQPIEPQTPDHNNQSTADTDHHNHFLDTTGGPPSLEVSIVSALNDENNQPVEDGDDHEHAKEEPTSSSSTSAHVTAPICESPTATDDDANNTTIGLSLTLPSSSSNEPLLCKASSSLSSSTFVHGGRRISFSCSYPRMQLSHIGSSPRVLLHTTQADITYVGHSSYSSGHIYPDQRCTVPKLLRGEFIRMASILDMVLLDAASLGYRYSELATAVILCCYEPEHLICQITGFSAEKMRPVRTYVEPFVQTYDQLEPTGTTIPCLPDVPHADRHNIQTYTQNCLAHLESVQQSRRDSELRRKALELRMAARVRKRKFGSTLLNHSGSTATGRSAATRTASFGR